MDYADLTLMGIAAAGGLIAGGIVSLVLPKTESGAPGLLGLLVMAGTTIAAGIMGPAQLEPRIGASVRAVVGIDVETQIETMVEFAPLYEAVREIHPQRINYWRHSVEIAYRDDGRDRANTVAKFEGTRLVNELANTYVDRVSDADLREYMETLYQLVAGQMKDSPRSCYNFYLPNDHVPGVRAFDSYDIDVTHWLEMGMTFVAESESPPIEYNRDLGLTVLNAIAMQSLSTAVEEDQNMMLGREMPEDDEEFAAVCDAYTGFLAALIDHPSGVLAFRALRDR